MTTPDWVSVAQEEIWHREQLLCLIFPCQECDSTGRGNPESYPYPEPCQHCWGRGYQIPEED